MSDAVKDEADLVAEALATVVPIGNTPQADELAAAVARHVSNRPVTRPSGVALPPGRPCPTCGGAGFITALRESLEANQ